MDTISIDVNDALKVDDLSARMRQQLTRNQHALRRLARHHDAYRDNMNEQGNLAKAVAATTKQCGYGNRD